MRISHVGIDFIKHAEELKLDAYQDSVGVLTIGYGHTGPDVMQNSSISPEYAEQLLVQDLGYAEHMVNKLVLVPLTQGQFDALVSFTFNLGARALKGSTLLSKLNSKDYDSAAEEFLKWDLAGGRKLLDLQIRRAAERSLFLGDQ